MKMKKSSLILGIDVGSVSIHLALVAPDKTLVFQTSCYHHGERAHSHFPGFKKACLLEQKE
ncbi:MAG: hypothetical protein HUK40_21565 [Desulfobacter sp.]|nr:hypothetical protein [Desulfobacter sp.]